jgi:DNA-binding transcriptional ArsR family regulator
LTPFICLNIVNLVVNYSEASLDITFSALADPTRRAILAKLASEPDASVTALASPFRMSLPAVSRHLRVLEDAGLLARRREGRVHHCRIDAAPLREAAGWIARYGEFWEGRLDALQRLLEATAQEEKSWPRRKRRPRPLSASRGGSAPRARGSSAPGRSRSS